MDITIQLRILTWASPHTLHVHDDGLLLGEDVVVLQLVLQVDFYSCGRHFGFESREN